MGLPRVIDIGEVEDAKFARYLRGILLNKVAVGPITPPGTVPMIPDDKVIETMMQRAGAAVARGRAW